MIRFNHEANSWQWQVTYWGNWQNCTVEQARVAYDLGAIII